METRTIPTSGAMRAARLISDEVNRVLGDVLKERLNGFPLRAGDEVAENWARIIDEKTAAPDLLQERNDLLAELTDVVDQLDGIGIPEWHGAEGLSLEKARALIAKIRGEAVTG